MRKVLALVVLGALIGAVLPASAAPATLAKRVQKLEAKMACLVKVPINEFADYASYGDPALGPNAMNTFLETSGNPDSLQDQGVAFGIDLNYGYAFGPDMWLIGRPRAVAAAKMDRLRY